VEHRVGAGAVLLFASSPAAGWDGSPAVPTYLPLLHELLTFQVGRAGDSRNVRTGETASVVLPRAGNEELDLMEPSGATRVVEAAPAAGGRVAVSLGRLLAAGPYEVLPAGVHLAANVPESEGDLAVLGEAERKKVFPSPLCRFASGAARLEAAGGTGSGRDWGVPLLIAALAAFLAESLLARSIDQRRRGILSPERARG
jgi:hypothetical protein